MLIEGDLSFYGYRDCEMVEKYITTGNRYFGQKIKPEDDYRAAMEECMIWYHGWANTWGESDDTHRNIIYQFPNFHMAKELSSYMNEEYEECYNARRIVDGSYMTIEFLTGKPRLNESGGE